MAKPTIVANKSYEALWPRGEWVLKGKPPRPGNPGIHCFGLSTLFTKRLVVSEVVK